MFNVSRPIIYDIYNLGAIAYNTNVEGFENIPIITSESQTTGINPAIDVFPGNLDFQVNVPTQGHKSKEAHVSEI